MTFGALRLGRHARFSIDALSGWNVPSAACGFRSQIKFGCGTFSPGSPGCKVTLIWENRDYPSPRRSCGIIGLAPFRERILGAQQVTGKILRANKKSPSRCWLRVLPFLGNNELGLNRRQGQMSQERLWKRISSSDHSCRRPSSCANWAIESNSKLANHAATPRPLSRGSAALGLGRRRIMPSPE